MAGVAALSLIVGALGALLLRDDPDTQLAQARAAIEARDEAIAERDGRIAVLRSELAQVGDDAREGSELKETLGERVAALEARERALAEREQALEGRWSLPRIDIPSPAGLKDLLARVSNWVERQADAEDALDRATQ